MTILSNKKQSKQQKSSSSSDLSQQQQSATLITTNTAAVSANSTSSSSSKQRLILLADKKDDSASVSSPVLNTGNKTQHLPSSPQSPVSSTLSTSSNVSSNQSTPEFKTLSTVSITAQQQENLFVEPTPLIQQQDLLNKTENTMKQDRHKRNKNNKRKMRSNNHNIPMPLPPPQQRQRCINSNSQVVKTTELTTKLKDVNELHYTGSLTSLNNSTDENRLNDSDDDSDFDNSDFDLNNKFSQSNNDTSSDREDNFNEENYNHLQQRLHFNQSFDFIHHHQQQQHQQQRRILEQEQNESVLLRNNTNSTNKPVKFKKKTKKNNLFNNNDKLKRNSLKENSKKENDYLNNNSEDEYERPIVIRNINGLGHNNNQILNGMNNDKNAAQFDVSSQSLLDVETIEELEAKFCQLLKEKKGFIIRPMKEDGACLFRAVADQIYGDEEMHSTIRSHCMDYIAKNADYFKQYMTEDVERYISRKRQDNCHGNHIEIIAIAEIYNRPIEVYEYSLEPKNTFQGVFQTDNDPIRLSYHGRNHYNSVVDPFKATIGVGLGLPQMTPGLAEKTLISEALKKSEEFHLEKTMLDDKLKATDWEATNEEIMELVARESYLQWLKDNEKRSIDRNSLNLFCDQQQLQTSTNAQCSNWDQSTSDVLNIGGNATDTRLNLSRRSSTSTPPRSPSHSKLSHFKTSPQQKTRDLFHSSLNSNETNKSKTTNISTSSLFATSIPTTSMNNNEENMPMQYQYYETKSIINELPADLFGLNSNDWIGLDNPNDGNDSDILARVLAASQQEYLESLKAKRQQNSKN